MALQEDLVRKHIAYDPETGEFTWREPTDHKTRPGLPAGHVTYQDYRVITVKGHKFQAHRLAWFFVHGKWPEGVIDHIDNNGLNNRIDNLRDVPQAVNVRSGRRHRK